MTWLEHHRESERYAADAEVAYHRHERSRAQELYAKAAEAEKHALHCLNPSKIRTYGISAVSVVSLYFKAARLGDAEDMAYSMLASGFLPGFASDQLRNLLHSIWSEKAREQAGVQFAPGQVMIAVKGGEIVEGGAPLDLIVDKVKTVQSLFYRTTELMKGLPHRKRGGPVKKTQESCRPWLFQAVPGSYQFAVAVQEPQQPELDMFEATDPRPKEIADKFLDILKASIESPEDTLPDVVQDADYRDTFLKLTRSLAPTGKGFNQVDIRSTAENSTITLDPTTRAVVTAAIRKHRSSSCAEPEPESKTEQIRGILRALHLDRDWIEISEGTERIKIDQVGEAVDDVIGPMVNRLVIVQIVRDRDGSCHFRDIEADE